MNQGWAGCDGTHLKVSVQDQTGGWWCKMDCNLDFIFRPSQAVSCVHLRVYLNTTEDLYDTCLWQCTSACTRGSQAVSPQHLISSNSLWPVSVLALVESHTG